MPMSSERGRQGSVAAAAMGKKVDATAITMIVAREYLLDDVKETETGRRAVGITLGSKKL